MSVTRLFPYGRDTGIAVRRRVNDYVAQIGAARLSDSDSCLSFVCECGDLTCQGNVELTLADYATTKPGSVVAGDCAKKRAKGLEPSPVTGRA